MNDYKKSDPAHGKITQWNTNGIFAYEPNPNFFGDDFFTYQANDGTAESALATVTIHVSPVNDPPIADPDEYNATEDTPFTATSSVLVGDTDVDSSPLYAIKLSNPSNGNITHWNPNGIFTYEPNPNFFGDDFFTYQANDGPANSAVVTVTIHVSPVNDPPIADPDEYNATEDTPFTATSSVLVGDTDVDSSPLFAIKLSDPSNGNITQWNINGIFTYEPNPNFFGDDFFTYQANDGPANSAVVTVTIHVGPVNDPPIADPDEYSATEDTPFTAGTSVLVGDTDVDSSPLFAIKLSDPSNGNITQWNTNGIFTYEPNPNFFGDDFFTYQANDGPANSAVVTVTIHVGPVNDPPIADPDEYSTAEETPFTATSSVLVGDTDVDSSPLFAIKLSDPSNGNITQWNTNGIFTYEPNTNFFGDDFFTYQANDGPANSVEVTVTIHVGPVNDPPIARPDSYTVLAHTSISIPAGIGLKANDTDADGDFLTVTASSFTTTRGTVVVGTNGTLDYTPHANVTTGDDVFSYTVTDNVTPVTGSVTVRIRDNAPPVGVNDAYTAIEDTVLSISAPGVLINDYDPQGQTITAHRYSNASHGDVNLNPDGSFSYTPDANFVGTDSFRYHPYDGFQYSAVPVTVSITVSPVNDAPIAENDGYTTIYGQSLSIAAPGLLGNDHDIDSTNLTVVTSSLSGPGPGTLLPLPNGSFVYHPPANFSGVATFFYRANDGQLDSNLATITITVTAPVSKFFVPNQNQPSKIFRYSEQGSALPDQEHWPMLPNQRPTGLTSNAAGTRLWMVTANKEVVVINGATGAQLSTWIPRDEKGKPLNRPEAITTDGTNLWIADGAAGNSGPAGRVYYYPFAHAFTNGMAANAKSSFSLTATGGSGSANSPKGLSTDGTLLWVLDSTGNNHRVFVYKVSGVYVGSWAVNLGPGAHQPEGITNRPPIQGVPSSNTNELWIVDRQANQVYYFPMGAAQRNGSLTPSSQGSFALHADNKQAYDIADPPPLTLHDPDVVDLPSDTPWLISGTTNVGVPVTVDGSAPNVFDAAGNFFHMSAPPAGASVRAVTAGVVGDQISLNASARTEPITLDDSTPVPLSARGIVPQYETTSFNARPNHLFADLQLLNEGRSPLTGQSRLGVMGLPSYVTLSNAAGKTTTGIPYVDLATALVDGALSTGDLSESITLEFNVPSRQHFEYQLVLFEAPNRVPQFTSLPVISVSAGEDYRYVAEAVDADGDALTYSLIAGPNGLSIDPDTGLLTWTTSNADIGNHGVTILVRDPAGEKDRQQFVLTVADGIPNRPPVWTSTPVTEARVDTLYTYKGTATDADADTLTFEVLEGPDDLVIDGVTGTVTWTPTDDDTGEQFVRLKVSDDANPAGFAIQEYWILVGIAPGNSPPIIVSTPPITHSIGETQSGAAVGAVTPSEIEVALNAGQSSLHEVGYTRAASPPMADVVLLLDDTGSFIDAGPEVAAGFPELIAQLQATFPETNFAFGVSRFEEYSGDSFYLGEHSPLERPFILNQPLLPTSAPGFERFMREALIATAPGNGYDIQETVVEALYQAATGTGLDVGADGRIVPPLGRGLSSTHFGPNGSTVDSGYAGSYQTQVNPGDSGDVPAFNAQRSFGFRFHRVSDLPSLGFQTVSAGMIDLPRGSAVWKFSANAGEFLNLSQVALTGGDSRWALYGPTGSLVTTASGNKALTAELTANGQYVLALESEVDVAPIAYSFLPSLAPIASSSLVFGSDVTGSIDASLQKNRYQFSTVNWSTLIFDAQSLAPDLRWTLTDQNGSQLFQSAFSTLGTGGELDAPPVIPGDQWQTLPAGTYTLTVDGVNEAQGAYRFNVHRLADTATTLPLGSPQPIEFSPGSRTVIRSFTTTPGQSARVEVPTGVTGSYRLRVMDIHGQLFVDTQLDSENYNGPSGVQSQLPATISSTEGGEYRIILDGAIQQQAPATMSLTMQVSNLGSTSVPGPGTALTLGATVSGSLDPAGQVNYYFDLAHTAHLYFDILDTVSTGSWKLFNQYGNELANQRLDGTSQESGWVANNHERLLTPGRYRLQVHGHPVEATDFALRVLDLSTTAPTLTDGSLVSETWTPAAGTKVYQLATTTEETWFFDSTTTDSAAIPYQWKLLDHYGAPKFQKSLYSYLGFEDSGFVTLPPGTYKLLVEGGPGDLNTTGANVSFAVDTLTRDTTALTLGNAVTVVLPGMLTSKDYTFTVVEDTVVYLEPVVPSYQASWSLTGPNGPVVPARPMMYGVPTPIVQPLSPGEYTLSLHSGQTMEVEFRVTDLASVNSPLAFGTTILQPAVEIPPPPGPRMFQFEGKLNDDIQIDFAEPPFFEEGATEGSKFLTLRLVDPFGEVIFSQAGADPNAVPGPENFFPRDLRLDATGRYTLLVEHNGLAPITQEFELALTMREEAPLPPNFTPIAVNASVQVEVDPREVAYAYDLIALPGEQFYYDGYAATENYPTDLLAPRGLGGRRLNQLSVNNGLISVATAGGLAVETNLEKVPFGPGSVGGVGFRKGSLPIVIFATDNWSKYAPDNQTEYTGYGNSVVPADHFTREGITHGYGAKIQQTIDSLNAVGAYTIGLYPDLTFATDPQELASEIARYDFVQAVARLTGALNGSNNTLPSGDAAFTIQPGAPLAFYLPTELTYGEGCECLYPAIQSFDPDLIEQGISTLFLHGRMDVELIASDPSVTLEVLTDPTVHQNLQPGETATFDIRLTGDGTTHAFDILFVRAGTGAILGSIPATITASSAYQYDTHAIDPDDDLIDYRLVGDTHGATINATTGVIDWNPLTEGQYTFTVEVSDGHGGRDSQTWTVSVGPDRQIRPNQPPEIEPVSNRTAIAGETIEIPLVATDPDLDPLRFLLDPPLVGELPTGLAVDFRTGKITWTPLLGQVGTYSIGARVMDGRGGVDRTSFTITVGVPQVILNSPPQITPIPELVVYAGEWLTHRISATDPQNDPLDIDVPVSPAGVAFDPDFDTLHWRPQEEDVGRHRLVARAKDNRGGVDLEQFTIKVLEGNHRPSFVTTQTAGPAGFYHPFVYQAHAIDPDEDLLSYSLVDKPHYAGNAAIDATTGKFTWTPNIKPQLGTQSFTIRADDGRGGSVDQTFTIDVEENPDNRLPQFITNPATVLRPGRAWYYRAIAEDLDGDPVTYGGSNEGWSLPEGMQLLDNNLFVWTPTSENIGSSFTITLYADDGRDDPSEGESTPHTFTLNVRGDFQNSPPEFRTTPDILATVRNARYSYDADAVDPDFDAVEYRLAKGPVGMFIDRTTGKLEWTPDNTQLGTHRVVVAAYDPRGAEVEQSFDLRVRAFDLPPAITSVPVTLAVAGSLYSYQAAAVDPEGQPIHYSVAAPNGAVVTVTASGLVRWNVPPAATGSYQVTLTATDEPLGLSAQQTYTIVVVAPGSTAADRPPVITSTPPAYASVGEIREYQVLANDPDGTLLTYSLAQTPRILNEPGEIPMTINSTGLITWKPTSGHLLPNALETVEVVVTSNGRSAYQRFPIVVRPVNREPVVTPLNNVTLLTSQSFTALVAVTDEDDDPIRFVMTGAPTGMTMDRFGQIRWTTKSTDIGAHTFSVLATDDRGVAETSFNVTLTVIADAGPQVDIEFDRIKAPFAEPNNHKDPNAGVRIFVPAEDDVAVTARYFTLVSVTVPESEGPGITSQLNKEIPLSADGSAWLNLLPIHKGYLFFRAKAVDASGHEAIATATFLVYDPSDNNAPTVILTAPTEGQTVTAPISVTGSVADDTAVIAWDLSATRSDGNGPVKSLASGSGNVALGQIANFDPTMLPNGSYTITLWATDGNNERSVSRTVTVEGRLKLGNFNLSFEDLKVPVAGIPITIIRTYDTLRANEVGDFGFGWNLEVVQPELSIDFGTTGPSNENRYPTFLTGTQITVKTPEGTEEGFEMKWVPAGGASSSLFGNTLFYRPSFTPTGNNKYELIPPGAGHQFQRVSENSYQHLSNLEYSGQDPFFGNAYQLKEIGAGARGLTYTILAETLETTRVADKYGNELRFARNGIFSNRGRAVAFERDGQGRIQQIIDPNGYALTYRYDTLGRLAQMYDRRATETLVAALQAAVGTPAASAAYATTPHTKFLYLNTNNEYVNFLDKIIDPLGTIAVDAGYNLTTGRLTGLTDADGNAANIGYDLGALTQTVSSAAGTSSTKFDVHGNPLSETAPAKPQIIYDYVDPVQGLPNVIREVVGAPDTPEELANKTGDDLITYRLYNDKGQVQVETDPRGLTTYTAYNRFGYPREVFDDRGSYTKYYYSEGYFGDMTGTLDQFENRTGYGYDQFGNVNVISSASGSTSFTYNDFGDLIETRDADNNVRTILYDNAGNQKGTQSVWTNPDNPSDQRPISTTVIVGPDGKPDSQITPTGTTSTQYDALGRPYRQIDQNGFVTETVYDRRGLAIETRSESRDATGAKVWQISRTKYDSAGRSEYSTDQFTVTDAALKAGMPTTPPPVAYIPQPPIATPSGTFGSRTIYDTQGRVTSTERLKNIDISVARLSQSNPSSLGTSTVNSSGTVQTSSSTYYDTRNRAWRSTDAYGRATETLYDRYDNVLETRTQAFDETNAPIWLVSRTVYDSLGRSTWSTEQFVLPRNSALAAGAELGAGTATVRATRTIYDQYGRVSATEQRSVVSITIVGQASSLSSSVINQGQLESVNETLYDSNGRTWRTISGRVPLSTLSGVALAQAQALASYPTHGTSPDPYATYSLSPGTISDTLFDSRNRQYASLGHPVPAESVGLTAFANKLVRVRSETSFNSQGQQDASHIGIAHIENSDGTFHAIDNTQKRTTKTKTDQFGRVVETISAFGTPQQSSVKQEYDLQGRVTADIDPLGNRKEFEFDTRGQLVAVTLPAVPHPTLKDAQNQPLMVRPRWQYGYDHNGSMVSISDNFAQVSPTDIRTDHDGVTGDDTRQTDFRFDVNGRQTSRTLPLGKALVDAWVVANPTGDVRSLAGQSAAFTEAFYFDDKGRQTRHVSFEGVTTLTVFDDTINGAGRVSETKLYAPNTYNNGAGTPSERVVNHYDTFGRVHSTERFAGASLTDTFTMSYDAQRRLIRETSPAGAINYEYDSLGRQSRVFTGTTTGSYAADFASPTTDIRYRYNSLGQLFSIDTIVRDSAPVDSDPIANGSQPESSLHLYDLLGRLSRQELPNDVVTGYTYKTNTDFPESLTHYKSDANNAILSDNTKRAEFNYATRADGKKTDEDETFWFDDDNNASTPLVPKTSHYDWNYDNDGRLTNESIDHFDNSIDRSESFLMDLVGNRLERSVDLSSTPNLVDQVFAYEYDDNDRLITETLDNGDNNTIDQTTTYGWTATQQTSKAVQSHSSNVQISNQTLAYNLSGRMSSVTTESRDSSNTVTSHSRVAYSYDPQGIRIRATDSTDGNFNNSTFDTVAGNTTEYLVDHRNFTGYAQTLEERTLNTDQHLVKQITYVFGHDEITQTTSEFNGTATPSLVSTSTLTFGHDATTNVRVLFDAAAAIAQAYVFVAYGELIAVLNSTGTVQTSNFTLQTSLLADGEYFDSRISQTYLRARWYNAQNGRFNRLDPFAGNVSDPLSFHKYGFVHGDPIGMTDPTGMFGLGGLSVSFSISGLMRGAAQGAVLGAALGGAIGFADGFSNEGSIEEAMQGFRSGAFYGAIFGAATGGLAGGVVVNGLSTLAKLRIMKSMLALNLAATGYGVYSAKSGTQGIFRASLGLFGFALTLNSMRQLATALNAERAADRTSQLKSLSAALDDDGGHSFRKHGAQTTVSDHEHRLRTGVAPGDPPLPFGVPPRVNAFNLQGNSIKY